MKILLTLSYDGTAYSGWQKQINASSVQQTTEEAIYRLTGEKLKLTGSGRTDAGVHAEGQTASFAYNGSIPPEKFYKALNAYLPEDIKAVKSEIVDDSFCACRSAKRKTYVYRAYVSEVELPLKERYAARVSGKIDVDNMREAANKLVGEHDFSCFSSVGGSVLTTVRKIFRADIVESNNEIIFIVTGNGFLYNMVRIIVGTLFKIGRGDASPDLIDKMFSEENRALGGETFPAKGLLLKSVQYEGE